jgi:DNA-binding CsgD family transcriptional regulator
VNVFEKKNSQWIYKGHIANLEESSRIMVKGLQQDVWISHPYRGIFRLKWYSDDLLHPQVTYYGQKSGLPSTLNNGVFSIRQRPVFGTINGIYVYDENKNKFLPDEKFNNQIGNVGRIKCLKEDASGNIWYVAEEEIGLLKIQDVGLDKKIEKYVFNELKPKLVGGFEFIYPYEKEEVLFGAEHGFIHFSPANVKYKSDVNAFISKVTSGDSVLMGGWYLMLGDSSLDLPLKLNYSNNSIAFHLGTSNFGDLANIKFRTRLLGLSDEWTQWTEEYKIGYTNLLAQRYTLEYQAMNAYGKVSPIGTLAFSIKPPWYKSMIALFFYVLMILALLYGFIRRQQKKFEVEKARLVEIHEVEQEETMQQVEDTKAALEQIQTEKLEDEIEFKNKELALATMHLVQKGELLQSIKSTLQIMIDKSANAEARKELQSLANLLSFDEKLDEDWAQFAYHFDKVHVNFLNRLRIRFPQLTPNDEKLCAYLRMNLNIKETAQMLNISVRGVEASRYRLRKKLNLPNEANLAEFMMGI